MIILDEKMPPPPPYTAPPPPPSTSASTSSPEFPPPPFGSRQKPEQQLQLGNLPPHLLLRVVYAMFPQTGSDGSSIEKQRKTLYWLTTSLRLVNRAVYLACMHVLRSTYLPAYTQLVRPPYTSDPFPLVDASSAAMSISPHHHHHHQQPGHVVQTLQRETRVLDLFVALKVREDVWTDESELHLERDESFRDLFDLMQPRSRLEDLVRTYGEREGVIYSSSSSSSSSSSYSSTSSGLKKKKKSEIPFESLAVSFSSRRVGLVLTTTTVRKKTIVEVERRKDEKLEYAAKALVRGLRARSAGVNT